MRCLAKAEIRSVPQWYPYKLGRQQKTIHFSNVPMCVMEWIWNYCNIALEWVTL